MNKISLKANSQIFINQDLMNAAFHYKGEIETSTKENNYEGMAFKAMSCLIFCAFSLEANANYIGYKLLSDWEDHERKSLEDKLEIIYQNLGLDFDKGRRPLQTVKLLVKFRNSLAHGKPEFVSIEKEVVGDAGKFEKFKYPQAGWEEYCTEENALEAYEHANTIWNDMLNAAGIEIMETLSGGSSVTSWKEVVKVERLGNKT